MGWYEQWKKTPVKVRKPSIFLLGFTIVGVGIILLPLPGPGWAVIFVGFAILASEFEFAMRVRDRLVHALKTFIEYSKRAWKRFVKAFRRR